MMKKLIFTLLIVISIAQCPAQEQWTGTWATAMQPIFEKARIQTNLSGHSVRQVLRSSIGGEQLRLQLSNAYSDEELEISSVYIALASDSCDIFPKSAKYLSFNGKRSVTLSAGEEIFSDALPFELQALQKLSVTIHYARSPQNPTIHAAPLTSAYIIEGECKPKQKFKPAEKSPRWYNIATLEVKSSAPAIVCIGNSITDGARCHNDRYERWPDVMADSLENWGYHMGVLNLGIGANKVLGPGKGDPLVKRFERDALQQHGVDCIILLEGVNDIGNAPAGSSESIAQQLISAYQEIAEKAHQKGIKIYIGTIMPFKGRAKFSTHFHEAARKEVNDWIRTQNLYDGVIDFDAALRDSTDHERLQKEYQADWLHPNPAGYAVMGKLAADYIKHIYISSH